MRPLTVVGLSRDGLRVVLRAGDEVFELALADVPSPRQPALPFPEPPEARPPTPREIQQRIRLGETAAEIAEKSGLPLAAVVRYEGPPLAEREYQQAQARRALVDGRPVDELVEEHMARMAQDPALLVWDCWLVEPGRWHVVARAGREMVRLRWDTPARKVSALDEPARQALRLGPASVDALGAVLRPVQRALRRGPETQRPRDVGTLPPVPSATAEAAAGQAAVGQKAAGHAAAGQAAADQAAADQAFAGQESAGQAPDDAADAGTIDAGTGTQESTDKPHPTVAAAAGAVLAAGAVGAARAVAAGAVAVGAAVVETALARPAAPTLPDGVPVPAAEGVGGLSSPPAAAPASGDPGSEAVPAARTADSTEEGAGGAAQAAPGVAGSAEQLLSGSALPEPAGPAPTGAAPVPPRPTASETSEPTAPPARPAMPRRGGSARVRRTAVPAWGDITAGVSGRGSTPTGEQGPGPTPDGAPTDRR